MVYSCESLKHQEAFSKGKSQYFEELGKDMLLGIPLIVSIVVLNYCTTHHRFLKVYSTTSVINQPK